MGEDILWQISTANLFEKKKTPHRGLGSTRSLFFFGEEKNWGFVKKIPSGGV